MKTKHIYLRFCILLLLSMLFSNCYITSIFAEQLSWTWSVQDKTHKDIVFTVYDVDKAQDAKLVITKKDDDSEKYIEPFSITNATQQIKITLSENSYLKSSQDYDAYIEDEDGNTTDTKELYLPQHSGFFSKLNYYTGKYAYPNTAILSEAEKYLDFDAGEKVIAEVGFQEYEGNFIDGNLVFSYPKQELGTIIKFIWKDAYGCNCSTTAAVEKRSCDYHPNVYVYRNGVSIHGSLSADQRLAAVVGDKIYYSPYGIKNFDEKVKCITFPSLLPENQTEIEIFIESSYGSTGTPKTYTIKNCDVWGNITAYPSMATGHLFFNNMLHNIKSISTTIDGVTYTSPVDNDGNFVLKYNKQNANTELKFQITDEAGCIDYINSTITSDVLDYYANFDTYPNHMDVNIQRNTTAYVNIGNKVYTKTNTTDEEKRFRIDYDNQIAGTTGYVWFEAEDGRISEKREFTIPPRKYAFEWYAEVTYMEGLVYLDLDKESGKYDIPQDQLPSAYVLIGTEKYPLTLRVASEKEKDSFWRKYDDEEDEYYDYEDELDEDIIIYYFKISYPRKKIGEAFQIVVNDNDGYSSVLKEKFEDLNIDVDIDTVTSESQKITGWGDVNSEVSITIGKKKYKCKANKDGYFSKKIKPQKVGTKITVSVKSPDGYKGSAKSKIVKPNKKAKFKGNVYVSNKDISFTVSNGRKGDKIELVISGKKYIKKLTSNKKNQIVKISLNNELKAGSKATVSIKDRFGTVCYKQNKIVYVASSIYVGMRESEVNYTTYGKPIEKNDYGSFKQWVYKKGNTTYYVYIENGVVFEIQKMNY